MQNEFDATDLALLAAGIAGCNPESIQNWNKPPRWSIDDADAVQEMAEMLHRLWLEIDENTWSAVFAYEVTWPLAIALGQRIHDSGEPLDTLHAFAEERAKALIAAAVTP